MFAFAALPALLQCIGLFFLEESRSETGQTSASWAEVFEPKYRPLLIVGALIALSQQITGINAVVYFAPEIFRQAGLNAGSTALLATVGMGAVNVLATTVSIALIDRLGRRPLLFTGLAGMALSLLWIVWGFWTGSPSLGIISVASLMIYIAMFAIGMGAVPWVVLSEIYPGHIRAQSIAVATFMSWVGNILVAYTFLDISAYLTTSGAFLIYALMCILSFLYFYKKLPETRGISLGDSWKKEQNRVS
jgi:MFS family permease